MLLRSIAVTPFILLLIFAVIALPKNAISQDATPAGMISGKVLDDQGNKIEGATVTVEGRSRSVVSDKEGVFQVEAGTSDVLIISSVGYKETVIPVRDQKILQVTLTRIVDNLNEVVVVGFGQQKKVAVTGAVSTLAVKEIQKFSTPSLSNAIAGKMPGIITRQASGEPGYDAAQVFIRGLATFGNNAPLILVDGVERNMNQINAQEVESFTILKDATATAVYGLRGANGVIIITTKRGQTGRPQVSFRAEAATLHALRFPEFISGYEYASLWNEAAANNGLIARWKPEELQKFKDGSDPYLYPNSNWLDAVLKTNTWQTINNLSVTGGSDIIKYYVNVGYTLQDGLYHTDPKNEYNTNTRINRYNFRSNVDINVFKNFIIQLGLAGIIQKGNYPGFGAPDIFNAIRIISPIAYPIQNPDGSPGGSATYIGFNPWARATQSGYTMQDLNTQQSTFNATWDLSELVTQGLKVRGLFSYDRNSTTSNVRYKGFEVKQYLGKDDAGNDIYSNPFREEQAMTYSLSQNANRSIYLEGQVNYNRRFDLHDVGAMVIYNQTDYVNLTAGSSLFNLPYRKQGVAARVNYAYDNRYLLEGDLGYNGTENFPKGKRFGLFPAVSGGWIISNEKFWNVKFINQLKIRASYGIVGNDQIGGARFLFLTTTKLDGQSYYFGRDQQLYRGMEENQIGNPDVTWERARKTNIGLDLGLFDNKLTLQVDAFHEYRTGILLQRATVPDITGFYPWSIPNANLGIVKNRGIDALLELKNSSASGWFYNARANFTYARNKVIENATAIPAYPYLETRGLRLGQSLGFVSNGYFKDAADIAMSPLQTFGPVRPGDIKYKDINGDGVVDAYDRIPIGNPRLPEMTFGFGGTIGYKSFDLSAYFTGAANTSLYIGGISMFPFYDGVGVGNITREYYDNRWTPRTPDALYPAVDVGNNPNNFVLSDKWIRNGNYLRFRNAEIGYNQPVKSESSIFNAIRYFINGTNLFTWDHIKFMDPEATDGTFSYPLQRSVNFGIQVDFK